MPAGRYCGNSDETIESAYGQHLESTGCHLEGAASGYLYARATVGRRSAIKESTVLRRSSKLAGLRKKAVQEGAAPIGSGMPDSITIGKSANAG